MLLLISDYLFNIRPNSFTHYGTYFSLSAVCVLAFSLLIRAQVKKIPLIYRKLSRKISTILFSYGTISLFLFFLRVERVPYLSMRLWLWLWMICFITGTSFFIYKEYRQIPVRKVKMGEEIKKKRYFEL